MAINVKKLYAELKSAGVDFLDCNSLGQVWTVNGTRIQDLPGVAAVIAAHDPTPPDVVSLNVDSLMLIGDGEDEVILSVRGMPLADVTIDVLTGTTPSIIQLTLDEDGDAEQPISCETAPCVIVFSAGDVSCKVRAL